VSDMWTPPSARSSQYPSRPTDGFDALFRKVEAIKTELRDATNGLLKAARLSVETGLLRVLGALVVEGALDVTGDATVSGTLDVTGDATFSGNLAVPNGSITNDALSNPVSGDVGNNYVLTTFTMGWVAYAAVGIAVPAGFTRAQVMAVSSIIGPTSDTWQMRVNILGVTGAEYTVFGNNGALGFARNLTGLSGGTITVSTEAQNLIASGANRGVATSVTVTFLK
jgi:hypothetical protein